MMKALLLSFLLVAASGCLRAHQARMVLSLESAGQAQLLFLNESELISLHETDQHYILRLLDKEGQPQDEYLIPRADQQETAVVLTKLSDNRFFFTAAEHAYNFSVDKGAIQLTRKLPFPEPPKGAVTTLFFFDGDKSASVFLNVKEQYNVYIDSAGIRLDEKVTFNTSHMSGDMSDFAGRKPETPDFIYAHQDGKLFFHMPTDVSFLSLDLKKNKMDIGLIYMEYKQTYVFRRYVDPLTGKRYALKQDKEASFFFPVPSFGVLGFSNALDVLTDPIELKHTPAAVVNGQLLVKTVKKTGKGRYRHSFYTVAPEAANTAMERLLREQK